MKAEIDGIFCSDGRNLETWRPHHPAEVFLELELSIRPTGGKTCDVFRIIVATPEAIQGRPERSRRKLLVVEQYDWQKTKAALEQRAKECDRMTWEETFDCLRHLFEWENEGC
jgi:hypothetical protein